MRCKPVDDVTRLCLRVCALRAKTAVGLVHMCALAGLYLVRGCPPIHCGLAAANGYCLDRSAGENRVLV